MQAYDQHMNMILGDVEETITTVEIDDETYEEIIKVVASHGYQRMGDVACSAELAPTCLCPSADTKADGALFIRARRRRDFNVTTSSVIAKCEP